MSIALGEFFFDVRAQHLDRDVGALGRHRAMDLRDRGGADRDFVDRREHLVDRAAEARLNRATDSVEGERRERVLQPHQIERGVLADQIGSRRQRLAELDRGGADRLERIGIARNRRHARAEPREPDQPAQPRRRIRVALDPAQRAMPREDAAPFQEPPRVHDRRGQIFQPEWIATSPPSIGSTLVWTNPASPIIALNRSIVGKRRIDSIR